MELKKSQLTQKRTRHGFPPVSPDACTKDAVAAEVFDHVWKNVIGVLEELVRKYWESAITGKLSLCNSLGCACCSLDVLHACQGEGRGEGVTRAAEKGQKGAESGEVKGWEERRGKKGGYVQQQPEEGGEGEGKRPQRAVAP